MSQGQADSRDRVSALWEELHFRWAWIQSREESVASLATCHMPASSLRENTESGKSPKLLSFVATLLHIADFSKHFSLAAFVLAACLSPPWGGQWTSTTCQTWTVLLGTCRPGCFDCVSSCLSLLSPRISIICGQGHNCSEYPCPLSGEHYISWPC